jgi:hypothetical protein
MKNYKIVIWDVETSPIEGYFWTLFKPRVSHENIKEDFQILCASYKDLGSKKVHSVKIDFDDLSIFCFILTYLRLPPQ